MARRGSIEDPVERVARSVELLVKLKIEELKNSRNQREMIQFLGTLGMGGGEISTLLGINRTTVDPELSKLRASNLKKGGRSGKRSRK